MRRRFFSSSSSLFLEVRASARRCVITSVKGVTTSHTLQHPVTHFLRSLLGAQHDDDGHSVRVCLVRLSLVFLSIHHSVEKTKGESAVERTIVFTSLFFQWISLQSVEGGAPVPPPERSPKEQQRRRRRRRRNDINRGEQ